MALRPSSAAAPAGLTIAKGHVRKRAGCITRHGPAAVLHLHLLRLTRTRGQRRAFVQSRMWSFVFHLDFFLWS